MQEGGWDLDKIDQKERLVLPGQTCVGRQTKKSDIVDLGQNGYKLAWVAQGWSTQQISTSFWDKGRVNILFANCNNEGDVTILVNGTEIKKSKDNGKETRATFNVQEGTNLTITAGGRGIIHLKGIDIECGNNYMLDIFKSIPRFLYI